MPGDAAPLLEFVAEINGHLGLSEFRTALLGALSRLVRSDWASLNEVGRVESQVAVVMTPDPPPELIEPFARLHQQNPLIQRYVATQDGRPYRFSDVVTATELRALDLYREVYVPMRVDHQIAFTVSARSDVFLGLALSRADPDYTDAERDLLDLVRPAIIQAYNNAALADRRLAVPLSRDGVQDRIAIALRSAGLTARESEVLALLAVGHSSASQAEHLSISQRTVGKHLENGYRKLGATSKAQAVRAAWDLAERRERELSPS